MLNASQIKALADLPPLPVMRATLLGTILAPASKLVRTLAEPARGLAAVIKAYSEIRRCCCRITLIHRLHSFVTRW